jgi:quercetin dioxygenase-like cupin family protein
MKKSLTSVSIAAIVAMAVQFVFGAEHKEARVTQRVNDVRLLAANAAPKPAAVNEAVHAGTAVKTGGDSRAELTFIDATIARLGSNTVFNVGSEAKSYDLGSGAVLLYAPKQAGTIKINTSVATAAVTGFTAMLEFHKNGWSKFIILEGQGTFSLHGIPVEPCQLRAGQIFIIPPHPTRCPEAREVDLNKLVKSAKLITDFPPLPSLNLIVQEGNNQVPPPGGFIDPTGIDTIDQGMNAKPPPPKPPPRGSPGKGL